MHHRMFEFVTMFTDDISCHVLNYAVEIRFYHKYKSCGESIGALGKLFLQYDR